MVELTQSATSFDPPRHSPKKLLCLSIGLLVLLISAAATSGHIAQQQETNVRQLELNKPVERELAGGETHAYQLTLRSGEYIRVLVYQRGVNVALRVFGPGGRKIVDSDINSPGDSEEASLIAEASAEYRVEVQSPDKNAPKGLYEIKLEGLRAATEQDKTRVAAERLVVAAVRLYREQTADSRRKAVEQLEGALALFRDAKDTAGEASTLYLMGHFYTALGEHQKALDSCNRGLPLARAAGDRKTEAYLLDTIGEVYNALGDKKKSLEFFNQALPLRRATGDRVGEVNTLNNIGIAYGWMGERQKALDYFNQVLPILKELGDRRKEASLLNNMCVIYSDLGEYKRAFGSCNQSLLIRRDLADREGEAVTINSIGNVHSNLGEYQQALDSYIQARSIYQSLGERQGEAVALNNIGWVYATLGEQLKAINFYEQSLQVVRALGDRYGETHVLSNIAVNYGELEEYQKALEMHLLVLPLRRLIGDRNGEAITLNNIAFNYSKLGAREKALDYYNQALALHRAFGNKRLLASTLRNVGVVYEKSGQYQKALDHLNEALQLSRTIGDRNGEAATLAALARLEMDRGNLKEARRRIEEALAAVESLRISVKSQQLRAAFFASVRKYHELYIELLMRLHKGSPSEGLDAAAFMASERGRARSLLELLTEARAEIRQGVDPALIERERRLRQLISDKADRQMRLLSGKYTEEQAAAAARDIAALTTEYEQLQASIRQTSPRYAALVQPAPLSLREIQDEVLDAETVLLEYSLGDEKSFLWAVTETSVSGFELPKRAEIERAARRVREMLFARNQSAQNETPEQRSARVEQSDAEYQKAAAALSRMLLGPAASLLKNRRLLVVGDGVLQYIPFAALPEPSSLRETTPGKETASEKADPNGSLIPVGLPPLIAGHEIINLPSASTLAVLRREIAGRKSADKTIAVLADPVFESRDPRVGASGKNRGSRVEETGSIADVRRSATESGLRDFVRLRFSRQEADEIMRFAPRSKGLKALDFDANRATATSPELGQYRFLHFATHALINNQHPELSGIVLSLFDEQGRPENGFLRIYDIYNLKLGADLVVLSACQTALGKEIKGEGLVGLTRGFMYAGVPRVVASLWQIDDRATAELMRRFYEGILREGMRPAAALRAAQVSMLKDKRWGAPYYWAAFTLQGEWR